MSKSELAYANKKLSEHTRSLDMTILVWIPTTRSRPTATKLAGRYINVTIVTTRTVALSSTVSFVSFSVF